MALAPYSSSRNSTFRSGNADVAAKQKKLIYITIGGFVLAGLIYWIGMPKTHPLPSAQVQSDLARMHADETKAAPPDLSSFRH